MEFDGEIIRFKIYDAMRYPSDMCSIYAIDVIDSLLQQTFDLNDVDVLKVVLNNNFSREELRRVTTRFVLNSLFQDTILELESRTL